MSTDLDAVKTHLQSPNYQGGGYVDPTPMLSKGNPSGMIQSARGQHSRRGIGSSPDFSVPQNMDLPSFSLPARQGQNSLLNAMYSNGNYGYGGNRRRDLNQRALRRGRRLSRKARHDGDPVSEDVDDEDEEDDEDDEEGDSEIQNNETGSSLLPPPPSAQNNTHLLQVQPSTDVIKSGRERKKNKRGRRKGKRGKKDKKKDKPTFGPYPVASPGTKEMAFVHAISSAGVAHALTKACSAGELENCGCDRSLRGTSTEGFEWSGCSDNVDFGVSFSRTFVDARDRRKSRKKNHAQPLMNLHNNEVGRKLLEKTMIQDCKCHGVSGSCELKTCWRSVASFRKIGEELIEKFDSAHEVRQKKGRGRRMLLPGPRSRKFKPHTDTDLVYLRNSPDYCEFDPAKGSLGTRGRECNPRSLGPDRCDLMCCNRGYTTRQVKRKERCKCKFHWCCFVECEECILDVEVSTCN